MHNCEDFNAARNFCEFSFCQLLVPLGFGGCINPNTGGVFKPKYRNSRNTGPGG
jgi:hypothetical protein